MAVDAAGSGVLITFYDIDPATGALALRATAGVIDPSSLSVTLSLAAVTFAPDHETNGIVALGSGSFLLQFPLDNATVATDDEEAVGFPLGWLIATSTFGFPPVVSIVGPRGAGGGGLNTVPWVLPAVRAHYFFDMALLSPFTAAAGLGHRRDVGQAAAGTAVAITAFVDRAAGDALRLQVLEVAAGSTTLHFGDSLLVTPAGAIAPYATFSLSLASPPYGSNGGASAVITYVDVSAGRGATHAIADIAFNGAGWARFAGVVTNVAVATSSASVTLATAAVQQWQVLVMAAAAGGGGPISIGLVERSPAPVGVLTGQAVGGANARLVVRGPVAAACTPGARVCGTSRGAIVPCTSAALGPVVGTCSFAPSVSIAAVSDDSALGLCVAGADGGSAQVFVGT